MPTINKKPIKFGHHNAQEQTNHNHNQREPNHNKPYNNSLWRKIREQVLRANPICVECKRNAATVADHIKPIRLGGEMHELNNIQALCSSCHNKKSAKESKIKTPTSI